MRLPTPADRDRHSGSAQDPHRFDRELRVGSLDHPSPPLIFPLVGSPAHPFRLWRGAFPGGPPDTAELPVQHRGPALEAIEASLALAGVAEAVPARLQKCCRPFGRNGFVARRPVHGTIVPNIPQWNRRGSTSREEDFEMRRDSVTKETFHCPDAMIRNSAPACPAPAVAA